MASQGYRQRSTGRNELIQDIHHSVSRTLTTAHHLHHQQQNAKGILMVFDRMRIPLLRSLSGPIGEKHRRKSKSRSRSRPDTSNSTSDVSQQQPTTPSTPILRTSTAITSDANTLIDPTTPPVPPIPRIILQNAARPAMLRKIWVKRPGASATRVEVHEDDLVDNVRDAILNKYANSLGRNIDSPDITLKLVTRDPENRNATAERVLGPEEPIGKTLDDHYHKGQSIEDALLIDVQKPKSTPKPSPRPGNHQIYYSIPEGYRPDDAARDYFGPMPAVGSPSLAQLQHVQGHSHSMAVLTTGQLPNLPSPGGRNSRRPKYPRQNTSSPTIMHSQTNGQLLGTFDNH